MAKSFKVSAPGRICLFGEHQDFLGLPVISMAINLRFEIEAKPRTDKKFVIDMPDINERLEFVPSEHLTYSSNRDYLKSAVNVLKRELGLKFEKGYDFVFHSDIPINAGCGSSSVMVVAWLKTLLHIHSHPVGDDPIKIAEFGYKAEVAEFGESGGKMDHYTAALGGLLFLDFGTTPPKIERLGEGLSGFVLGDSLQPKATVEILRKSRSAAEAGFKFIREKYPEFDLRSTPIESVRTLLDELDEDIRKVVNAQLVDRDLLKEAYAMFKSGQIDDVKLGEMLYRHHQMLRDIGVSTEWLDTLLEVGMKAGALGGKLNGSGGGGTFFLYAPGKEHEVAKAIEEVGARSFIIRPDVGVKVHE